MGKSWLTNGLRIFEWVLQPLKEVVWQVEGWNGKPILYGDETSLFIFDPDHHRLHALSRGTYLRPRIIDRIGSTEEGVGSDVVVVFRVQLSLPSEVRLARSITKQEWLYLRALTRDCRRSREFLANFPRKN